MTQNPELTYVDVDDGDTTSLAKRNGREAPSERTLTMSDVAQQVVSETQFQILRGKTPKHAIKTRPGRGDKLFRYIPHGFVTDQLNKAFGWNWDFRLLPVFNGNLYQLTLTQEQRWDKKKKQWQEVTVRNLAVYGELVVRIHNPHDVSQVIATITKPGPGSQNWEETIEFGDALKGAKSDGLKVAAHELGIGLDLYYDDDAELQRQQREDKYERDVQAVRQLASEGKTPVEIANQVGLDVTQVKAWLTT